MHRYGFLFDIFDLLLDAQDAMLFEQRLPGPVNIRSSQFLTGWDKMDCIIRLEVQW